MKRLAGVIILTATVFAIFASCRWNTEAETSDKLKAKMLPILGTWRYASMTCVMPGDKLDTVSTIFGPDTIQIYDVYRCDSILESYVTLDDSILRQTQMHYVFRNDSIIAYNKEKSVQVQVINATDSTLIFEFTLGNGDKTAYCKTFSERCELPDWLRQKIIK